MSNEVRIGDYLVGGSSGKIYIGGDDKSSSSVPLTFDQLSSGSGGSPSDITSLEVKFTSLVAYLLGQGFGIPEDILEGLTL